MGSSRVVPRNSPLRRRLLGPLPRGRRSPRIAIVALFIAGSVGLALAVYILSARVPAATGGQGQAIDGIPCDGGEQTAYHVHAHLAIIDDGQNVLMPAGIGIVGPWRERYGSIAEAQCYYWLHTHDSSGIVHVEAPSPRQFTLGNLFDIWGQPLDATVVGPSRGNVMAFVDGRAFSGNVRSIPLVDHAVIVLEVGRTVPPPSFQFPLYDP